MDDFLDLREGVGIIWFHVVAHIVVGLIFFPRCSIVFAQVVHIGIFVLVAFTSRFFLFLQPGELLVIVDEVQIVLIVRLLLFLALLLFLLLFLFLFVFFGLSLFLFVIGVASAVWHLIPF